MKVHMDCPNKLGFLNGRQKQNGLQILLNYAITHPFLSYRFHFVEIFKVFEICNLYIFHFLTQSLDTALPSSYYYALKAIRTSH